MEGGLTGHEWRGRMALTIGACLVGVLLAAAPVLAGLIVPPNPDVSWLLLVAERLLEGARFGRDVIEINPPLIAWMTIPAGVIARAMGISPVEAYQAGVSLACAVSAAWCARLLPPSHPAAANRATAFAVGCFLLAWLPTSEFGQREHLSVILVAPYLLVGGRRLDGVGTHRWEAGTAGAIAGLGFALKPFFLLPLLLVEAGLFTIRRPTGLSERPELVGALLILGAYPVAIGILAPDYLDIIRTYWPAYRGFHPVTLLEGIGHGVTRPWLGLAAVGLACAGWNLRHWALELVLALTILGFGVGALVQQRAWLYLWLPVLVLGWGLLILLLARTRGLALGRAATLARALAVVAAIAALGGYGLRWVSVAEAKIGWASQPGSSYQLIRGYVERCARGQPVAALAPFHYPAFPAIADGGGRWSLRFNALWPIAAALRGIEGPGPVVRSLPPGADPSAHRALKMTAADLLANPPRLILVPVLDSTAANPAGYQRVDFLGLLSADSATGSLLRTYAESGRTGVVRVLLHGGQTTDLDCGWNR